MTAYATARKHMVESQIHTSGVIDPGILEAFETVPREKFLPPNMRGIAYSDDNLKTSAGCGLLAPTTHARMIQALAPQKTDVVLDIGGSTGYSSAIFSMLVQTVFALEQHEEHLKQAAKLWQEINVSNILGFQGDLTKGCPKHAPFDIIFMNGCVTEIPAQITEQLADQGRMITIVKEPDAVMGRVTLVRSLGGRNFSSYTLFEASGQYLHGFEPVPSFCF